MIFALKINNIAIIEDMEMELTDGLNVLTGETGAGKSIILDALGLVLGNRGLGDFIRTGSDKAIVQAVFCIKGSEDIDEVLKTGGIPVDEDGILILTRELNRTGRHVCRVNGQIVPLAILKEIGQQLVDTHSQHEQQSLLAPQRQRELLDRFGGDRLLDLLHLHIDSYNKWQEKVDRLVRQKRGAKERLRRMDNLEFQIEEIKKAELK
ncbi:MAG TPA: AAA family ATPase, partial [Clostridia bacterium]|nr:AAA family ATPase [Clostridia bacterium]